jgi:hypothetical protein
MFDMDQFMADREAAKRPRPLSEQEHREYHSGDPEPACDCDRWDEATQSVVPEDRPHACPQQDSTEG